MTHKRVLHDVYVGGLQPAYVKSAVYSLFCRPLLWVVGSPKLPYGGLSMSSSKGSMGNTQHPHVFILVVKAVGQFSGQC